MSFKFINCMYGCGQQYFSMNSSTFNPLVTILNQNKLTGSNYVDQKRNLDIVLTASGCKYVLTTPCPPEPEPDAPQDQKDLYTKWLKDDEMAKCCMQAFMSSVLQHQYESFKSASDIISNLNEMFGDQGRPARQAAMRACYTLPSHPASESTKHVTHCHLTSIEYMVVGLWEHIILKMESIL